MRGVLGHALQFRDEGVLVTVRTRNFGPDLPEVVRLDDLEPSLRRMEQVDRKDVVAFFSALWGDQSGSRSST